MSRISVLLADDHLMLLDGLICFLQQHFNVLGAARDGHSLIEMAKQKQPEVIVMDIGMPSLNGINTTRILQDEGCQAKVLFLTMQADLPLAEEALRAGAFGVVLKVCDMAELVRAIQAVAQGSTYVTPILGGDLVLSLLKNGPRSSCSEMLLTKDQRKVLQLLVEGKTMNEAAFIIGISKRTAESHKYEMMRLLGVQTSASLIR